MGSKYTFELSRIEAIHIIMEYTSTYILPEHSDSIDKCIESILKNITNYNNPKSNYYNNKFIVREIPDYPLRIQDFETPSVVEYNKKMSIHLLCECRKYMESVDMEETGLFKAVDDFIKTQKK